MNVSIIDIGTQSLKHYIFEVNGTNKKVLHYKRYSDANLGENTTLTAEAIQRNITLIKECLELNEKESVSKVHLLGTEILRKAENASEFLGAVKELSGHDVQVISQDLEARYLYDGFVEIVSKDFNFAAVNIGGGSTEVVMGDSASLKSSKKIPFGVKYLRNTFTVDGKLDWEKIDDYLSQEIALDGTVDHIFVTGVLDFITAIGPHLGFVFEKNETPNHPVKVSLATYESFLKILRNTPVEELKSYYPRDPNYATNFALGQSVYVAVAKKLAVKDVIPSENNLTDGVIYQMTR